MGKCEQCIVREFSAIKALNKDELLRIAVLPQKSLGGLLVLYVARAAKAQRNASGKKNSEMRKDKNL